MDNTKRQKSKRRKRKKKQLDGPGYFMVSHDTLTDTGFLKLPLSAQMLYIHLCRLRNRYTNGNNWTPDRTFFRHDTQLAKDTGMSVRTIIRARKCLSEARLTAYNPIDATYTLTDSLYKREQEQYRDADALGTGTGTGTRTLKPVPICPE